VPIFRYSIACAQVIAALLWAGATHVLLGLYVLEQTERSLTPVRADLALWLGALGVIAGNFIFMVLVADRILSFRKRLAVDLLEAGVGLGVLACIAMLGFRWLTGAGP